MRAAELLRGLADVLSAIEDDKPQQAPVVVNVNHGGSGSDIPTDSHGDDGNDSTKHLNPTMVPPLQQKIEMMKKLAGIPSRLDQKIDLVDDDEPFNG
jgi:hypothetical protein